MKLSIWIFADWLEEYHPVLQIPSGEMNIENIRLFSQNTIMSDSTLYVGRLKDFFANSNSHVVCIHKNDLIILPTDDMEEIFNIVMEAMEFYSTWNVQMLEIISRGGMVADLLRHSENILKEPIFILNSGQRLLAMSSQYKKHQVDPYWDELIDHGSANLNFILKFNQTFGEDLFKKRGLYLLEGDMLPHKAYSYNFFLNDAWIGVINLIQYSETLSQGTLDLLNLFSQYINMWFNAHAQQQSMLFLDSLFHFALSNQACDYENFNRQLELLNWKKKDRKILITMINSSEQYNVHNHLCRTINDLIPYAYAITHNSHVCVLCNISQRSLSLISQDILPWLNQSGYYGCYSNAFTELEFLFEHFQQTKITARLCSKENGHIYNFENHMMKYGFAVMKRQIHTSLIHPAVTHLLKYDSQNHTEFGHTLHMYMMHERSQSRTAAALNLHRNTLTYRLHRLQELISCDLDDPKVRMHLLVSYELLECETSNEDYDYF